jgi:hypothetical protein
MTFIYFIRAGDFIKIGQSKDWKARLGQMQTGSPHALIPLLVLVGEPSLEKRLHSRFSADHFRGEWFYLKQAISDYIRENLPRCVARHVGYELSDRRVNKWLETTI